MNRMFKLIAALSLIISTIMMTTSCKNTDPSVLKIFVRSSSNELLEGAQVVVIGDLQSNPPTNAFVDTLITNSSGFVVFNMNNYFDAASEANSTGYFDVIAKKNTKSGSGYVRCRMHLTTVETVFLLN
ncbi:MAG: hypothetical protein ACK5FX_07455 [Flavobacteriia bacterium]|jgi:hypothetical protein